MTPELCGAAGSCAPSVVIPTDSTAAMAETLATDLALMGPPVVEGYRCVAWTYEGWNNYPHTGARETVRAKKPRTSGGVPATVSAAVMPVSGSLILVAFFTTRGYHPRLNLQPSRRSFFAPGGVTDRSERSAANGDDDEKRTRLRDRSRFFLYRPRDIGERAIRRSRSRPDARRQASLRAEDLRWQRPHLSHVPQRRNRHGLTAGRAEALPPQPGGPAVPDRRQRRRPWPGRHPHAQRCDRPDDHHDGAERRARRRLYGAHRGRPPRHPDDAQYAGARCGRDARRPSAVSRGAGGRRDPGPRAGRRSVVCGAAGDRRLRAHRRLLQFAGAAPARPREGRRAAAPARQYRIGAARTALLRGSRAGSERWVHAGPVRALPQRGVAEPDQSLRAGLHRAAHPGRPAGHQRRRVGVQRGRE